LGLAWLLGKTAARQNVGMSEAAERSAEEFLIHVLSNASDDLQGVYEVWWHANGWYPHWPLSRRLQLAEDTVATLLSEGLVRMFRGDWETADGHPVPDDETATVLGDWETWAVPQGPHVFLFATAEGGARLRSWGGGFVIDR
jgi:hypothetical protein